MLSIATIRLRQWLSAVACLLALSACGGSDGPAEPAGGHSEAELSPQSSMGAKIFKDPSLSASGRQSCDTCHDADNAHSPATGAGIQSGGPLGDLKGSRNTPSI